MSRVRWDGENSTPSGAGMRGKSTAPLDFGGGGGEKWRIGDKVSKIQPQPTSLPCLIRKKNII